MSEITDHKWTAYEVERQAESLMLAHRHDERSSTTLHRLAPVAIEMLTAYAALLAAAPRWTAQDWFVACKACTTATHCGHHHRCLAQCTPADLAAAPSGGARLESVLREFRDLLESHRGKTFYADETRTAGFTPYRHMLHAFYELFPDELEGRTSWNDPPPTPTPQPKGKEG